MKKICDSLKKNRIKANVDNLVFDVDATIIHLYKKATSYMEAQLVLNIDDMVDILCDMSVFAINNISYLGYQNIHLDAINHKVEFNDITVALTILKNNPHKSLEYIVSMCFFLLEDELGYDSIKCLHKHIKPHTSPIEYDDCRAKVQKKKTKSAKKGK